jgi:APA family basic amino acid/polyamine antiporter
LILLRTRDPNGGYGNLYNDLLSYVVASVLIFYSLTIVGIFVLRAKRPEAERPYKAFGYPILPALYVIAAMAIVLVLVLYQTQTAGRGVGIVVAGIPVYWLRLLWLAKSERAN